jgi:hypothetical protein
MDAAINERQDHEPRTLAQEALAECPQYVEHICGIFSACRSSLRAGEDTIAMNTFARGASDLGQFIKLFTHINRIAQPESTQVTDAYAKEMHACISSIDLAMHKGDMVAVSDEIDSRLVPLLQRFPEVAREVGSGLC